MKLIKIASLLLFWTFPTFAQAGPYTDELSRCLVQSSTDKDKLKLVKWMFTAMALHPAVADLAQVSVASREAANQDMAALLSNLLEERCLDQARTAIENEGAIALQSSFSILGQVAANNLFSDPSVAAGLASLTEYLDSDTMEQRLGIGGN